MKEVVKEVGKEGCEGGLGRWFGRRVVWGVVWGRAGRVGGWFGAVGELIAYEGGRRTSPVYNTACPVYVTSLRWTCVLVSLGFASASYLLPASLETRLQLTSDRCWLCGHHFVRCLSHPLRRPSAFSRDLDLVLAPSRAPPR